MQDLPLAPSLIQILGRCCRLGRILAISPFTLISAGLVISVLAVSCLVWDWSHHLYPPLHWKVALDDSLVQNSNVSWDEGTNPGGNCRFTHGTYRVSIWKQNMEEYCTAGKTNFSNFSNFAVEVQMTIPKHGYGGLIFDEDDRSGSYYEF